MRALWRATIWHPDAPSMARVQSRFRPLFRYGLPIFDAVLIAFSVFGVVFGSNAVREFTAPWFTPVLAAGIGVSSFLAMVGLIFHRVHVELTAKVVLGACLALYVAFLIASATVRSSAAALSAALAVAVIVILVLRILDLIGEAAIEDDLGREGDE